MSISVKSIFSVSCYSLRCVLLIHNFFFLAAVLTAIQIVPKLLKFQSYCFVTRYKSCHEVAFKHWGYKTVFLFIVHWFKEHSHPFVLQSAEPLRVAWTFNCSCVAKSHPSVTSLHLHGSDPKLQTLFLSSASLNWHWEELFTVLKHFTSKSW